jgi:rhodanese-related sulfurtransferase
MLAAIFGLVTHNPALLFLLAILGIAPFWFPAWHPVDRFYNHVVAPLLGATRLPPNPFPRRIACVSAGILNTAAAIALMQGAIYVAYGIGGLLFILQLIVNTTHFCLASFLIEIGLRMIGKSLPTALIEGDEANRLIQNGAILIDVRDRSEFAIGHLPSATNIPLTSLKGEIPKLRENGQQIVLYCATGGRAKIAHGLLAQSGVCGIHNLGTMERWALAGN